MSIPPSSPRLPSPPPPTEIQIGPQSPSLGNSSNQESSIEQSVIDANASRRIHPGTKSADMAAGPPLVPLSELDSAFQLQEHLKALHYHYTKPDNEDNSIAITRETAVLIANQPEGVDRALWLYELCRFLINKCNDLIIGFLFDDPPCSATTCPEMRASEWQFLCAVHESPKSCCAIDYCCHTLDWATNIVTSQKIFPSRLSLGAGDSMDERGAGVKHLINIFRRLHRIFAHAWFQHRGVFWQVEGQTGLYVLFKTVCDSYELLPAENYKLPPEAEGLEPTEEARATVPSIMKADSHRLSSVEEDFINVGRANTNTRRHIRQSPSVGSAVTTVLESDEEDPDITQKLDDLNLEDEEAGVDIPVIVESYEENTPQVTVVEKPESDSEPEPGPQSEPKATEHVEERSVVQDEAEDSTASSWDITPSDSDQNKPVLPQEEKIAEQPEEAAAETPETSEELISLIEEEITPSTVDESTLSEKEAEAETSPTEKPKSEKPKPEEITEKKVEEEEKKAGTS